MAVELESQPVCAAMAFGFSLFLKTSFPGSDHLGQHLSFSNSSQPAAPGNSEAGYEDDLHPLPFVLSVDLFFFAWASWRLECLRFSCAVRQPKPFTSINNYPRLTAVQRGPCPATLDFIPALSPVRGDECCIKKRIWKACLQSADLCSCTVNLSQSESCPLRASESW